MNETVAIVIFVLVALFLILRLPIGTSLGLATMLTIVFFTSRNLTFFTQAMSGAANSFPIMAIPFFILAGDLMGMGGVSGKLLKLADVFFGKKYGGMAMITVVTCMFFAAISGSGPATVAAIGGITIPAMIKQKYDKGFAGGISAASGSIGVIIPPSIPMVVYGIATNTSIAKLFMAGFFPGLLIGIGLIIYSKLYCNKRKYISETAPDFSWGLAIRAFWEAKWALIMPFIILGGIYGGIFTPTEAAAVACVYGFILGVFVYKELKLKDIANIISGSAVTSAVVMFVIACATGFSKVLSIEGVPAAVGSWITSVTDSRILILLMINVLLLIVGCFIETNSAIMILAPILLPVVTAFGMDPIHLGMIMVANLALGMVTPPVGCNLFVACNIANVDITEISKSVIPIILVTIISLLLITFVEPISMFLPNLLMK